MTNDYSDLKNMIGRTMEKFKDVPLPNTIEELHNNIEYSLERIFNSEHKFQIKATYKENNKE